MPVNPKHYQRKESKLAQINWLIVSLVITLGLFGVAMLYSAAGGSMEPWAGRHLLRFLVAVVMMLTIGILPNQLLFRYAYLLYFGCFGLLGVVEVMGHIGMGAQRWISLGGVMLQPSELMKLALILALARYYHSIDPESINRPLLLLPPLVLIGAPVVLILLQPNLGTATITSAIGAGIMFVAGLYWRYFIGVAISVAAAVPIAWQFMHDYQKRRVETFLNPEADPLGAGYNIMQSKIAIGSGGIFGKGYMEGSQGQLDFLPEKHTDFIFTMIAEEFGFVGATFTIGLFLLLIFLSLATAARSRSKFGAIIAAGIGIMLILHMAINMGMVMGLLPVVGIPLPLLSYGGTMIFAIMAGFGLLLNSYVHRDEPLSRGGRFSL